MRLRYGVVIVLAAASTPVACSTFEGAAETTDTPDGGAADAGAPDDAASDATTPSCLVDTDFASDPNHCGRCGHSCIGGACVAGRCQPVEIGVSEGEDVLSVAVDATHVYWMTTTGPWSASGHVYACPKNGCTGAPASLAEEGALTGNIGGDGKDAFATFVFGSRRVTHLQGEAMSTVLGFGDAFLSPGRIVARAGHAFVLDMYEENDAGGYRATLFDVADSGKSVAGVYQGAFNVVDIALADEAIFVASTLKLLKCVPPCTGAFADFADVDSLQHLATDGPRLYFVVAGARRIVATPTTAYAETELLGPGVLGDVAAPTALVPSGGKVWATSSKGDFYECTPVCKKVPFAHDDRGGPSSRLADFGNALTADDDALYWVAAEDTDGDAAAIEKWHVMKIAKP